MQQPSRLKTALTYVLAVALMLTITAPAFAAIDFTTRIRAPFATIENDNSNAGDAGFTVPDITLLAGMEPMQGVHGLFGIYTANSSTFNTGVSKWAADITVTNLSPNFTLHLGDVSITQAIQPYSGGANVYTNPLISSSFYWPLWNGNGVGLSGSMNRVSWNISATKGQTDSSGWAIGPGVSVQITPGLKLAANYRHYSSSDTGGASGVVTNDYENVNNGVIGGSSVIGLTTAGGNADDANHYEVGIAYTSQTMPLSAKAWYNVLSAEVDSNDVAGGTGTTGGDEEYSQIAGQVVYNVTPAAHLALRYAMLTNESANGSGAAPNAGAGDSADRITVGGGYQYSDNLQFRLEYIDQQIDDVGATSSFQTNLVEFSGFQADAHLKFGAYAPTEGRE